MQTELHVERGQGLCLIDHQRLTYSCLFMRGALSWGVSGSGLSGSHCARTSVSLPCRGHRIVCQAEGGHGNPKVQDTLVDLLQVQITQEKV